jgi:hypothetical protein
MIASVLLVVLGLGWGVQQCLDLSRRGIAPGRVISTPYVRNGRHGGGYRIVADFVDDHQQGHQYRSTWNTSTALYRVGDAVPICYVRADPDDNDLCTFTRELGIPFALTGLGLVVAGFGVVLTIGARWFERAYPPSRFDPGTGAPP